MITPSLVTLPGLTKALETFLTCRPAGSNKLHLWLVPADETVEKIFDGTDAVSVILHRVDPEAAAVFSGQAVWDAESNCTAAEILTL